MPRKFPLYLTQEGVDEVAQVLYTHQHMIDVAHGKNRAPDRAFHILSELRRQCCARSGAADPFPDLPLGDGFLDGAVGTRGRR